MAALTVSLVISVRTGMYINLSNADALIEPYLFQGFRMGDLNLPSGHPLIAKWPLFLIQGMLPINATTFGIFNAGLFVLTILGWLVIVWRMLGLRVVFFATVLVAVVLLASPPLMQSMFETTTRNIEYVVMAGAIAALSVFARGSRTRSITVAVGVLLAATTISSAGDSLLLLMFVPAAAVPFIIALRTSRRRAIMLAIFIAVVVVVALALRGLIQALGFAHLISDPADLQLVGVAAFVPSQVNALNDVLQLTGASLFGQSVGLASAVAVVGLVIVVLGIVGGVRAARSSLRTSGVVGDGVAWVAGLSLAAAGAYVSYSLSARVVALDASGNYTAIGNGRYVSMVPLILITAASALLAGLVWRRSLPWVVGAVALVSLLASGPSIVAQNRTLIGLAKAQSETADRVTQVLKAHHIDNVISGYWSGPLLKFRDPSLEFVSVLQCTVPAPVFNTRNSWLLPDGRASAIVIDRKGLDSVSWTDCDSSALQKAYGPPAHIVQVSSRVGETVSVWIYGRDLRADLRPVG